MIPKKDRIRGSLIGGAIGDALGYPVEFVRTYENILKKYGQGGITRYDTSHWWREESAQDAKAWISDDTQMTLYTACGLINARENKGLVLPSILSGLRRNFKIMIVRQMNAGSHICLI